MNDIYKAAVCSLTQLICFTLCVQSAPSDEAIWFCWIVPKTLMWEEKDFVCTSPLLPLISRENLVYSVEGLESFVIV